MPDYMYAFADVQVNLLLRLARILLAVGWFLGAAGMVLPG